MRSMRCGHQSDTVVDDVRSDGQLISVEACGYCFDYSKPTIQPACILADKDKVKAVTQTSSIAHMFVFAVLIVLSVLLLYKLFY